MAYIVFGKVLTSSLTTHKVLSQLGAHSFIYSKATKYVVWNKFKLKLAYYLMTQTSIHVYRENFVELTH